MNKLILVSGVSGSGKTTIMRSIMENEIISFTTRQPRFGEVDGVDYLFITNDKFDILLKNNGLIEHSTYGGNHYGVTKDEFEAKISQGNAFFICDVHGMKQMKDIYSDCVSIFIEPESKETVEQRMRKRGDSEENIKKRLNTYENEMLNVLFYDYIVTNREGQLEETLEIVKAIIGGGF